LSFVQGAGVRLVDAASEGSGGLERDGRRDGGVVGQGL